MIISPEEKTIIEQTFANTDLTRISGREKDEKRTERIYYDTIESSLSSVTIIKDNMTITSSINLTILSNIPDSAYTESTNSSNPSTYTIDPSLSINPNLNFHITYDSSITDNIDRNRNNTGRYINILKKIYNRISLSDALKPFRIDITSSIINNSGNLLDGLISSISNAFIKLGLPILTYNYQHNKIEISEESSLDDSNRMICNQIEKGLIPLSITLGFINDDWVRDCDIYEEYCCDGCLVYIWYLANCINEDCGNITYIDINLNNYNKGLQLDNNIIKCLEKMSRLDYMDLCLNREI